MRTSIRYCLFTAVCMLAVICTAHATPQPITLAAAENTRFARVPAPGGDWKTVIDTLQIKISYSIAVCDGNERVLVRVENTSSQPVILSWSDKLVSGASLFSNEGTEQPALTLQPGQAVSGACNEQLVNGRRLVFPLDLYMKGKNNYDINTLVYVVTGFSKSNP